MKRKHLAIVILLIILFSWTGGFMSDSNAKFADATGAEIFGCYDYWTWTLVKDGDWLYYCYYRGMTCTPCIVVTPE